MKGKSIPAAVSDYMAAIGSKGGKAKGAPKRRSKAHYRALAKKRWGKKPVLAITKENRP